MTPNPPSDLHPKLILRGIHLELTDAMKRALETKAERLTWHEPRIIRLRIDVERSSCGRPRMFTAKGHIEIAGPDVRAAVTTSDAYNAMSMLIDKLDRMLRKRTTAMLSRRVNDDIRAYVDLAPAH